MTTARQNNARSLKAMIFAAGIGSRLKPWTDHHPKALAVVNGKTLLQRNIEYLQSFGINEVVVNVHHFAEQIVSLISESDGWGSQISISDETDQLLETGGGLKKAAAFFGDEGDFVVMNVDILTNLDMHALIAAHRSGDALATLAVSKRDTSRYFLFDDNDRLSGWENVKTGEKKIVRDVASLHRMAFSGIHVINASIFEKISQTGKFSMVDVYLDLAKGNEIHGFDHTGAELVDVGRPESVVLAERIFR